MPGLDENETDDIPADEEPFNVALTNAYENGDWPPLAATIALNELPEDLDDIGQQVEHFPGSPSLRIDPAIEEELVRELHQRGYGVRRDDDLLGGI